MRTYKPMRVYERPSLDVAQCLVLQGEVVGLHSDRFLVLDTDSVVEVFHTNNFEASTHHGSKRPGPYPIHHYYYSVTIFLLYYYPTITHYSTITLLLLYRYYIFAIFLLYCKALAADGPG